MKVTIHCGATGMTMGEVHDFDPIRYARAHMTANGHVLAGEILSHDDLARFGLIGIERVYAAYDPAPISGRPMVRASS